MTIHPNMLTVIRVERKFMEKEWMFMDNGQIWISLKEPHTTFLKLKNGMKTFHPLKTVKNHNILKAKWL